MREHLAIKTFSATSAYDRAIAGYLNRESQTGSFYDLSLPLVTRLRYGENAHQEASLYGGFEEYFQKLHGKELSFNNILDISAAAELIGEFEEPTIAILKHTNPVRGRQRRGPARGVGQGVRHGQAGTVWRHHRTQPAPDGTRRARPQRDLQRGHHRAGL